VWFCLLACAQPTTQLTKVQVDHCHDSADARCGNSLQELFVFQKIDGAWKIARYCFCTTNPPPS